MLPLWQIFYYHSKKNSLLLSDWERKKLSITLYKKYINNINEIFLGHCIENLKKLYKSEIGQAFQFKNTVL